MEDIQKGMLFGAVEVDIAINENLYDYFKEHAPFLYFFTWPSNEINWRTFDWIL